MLIYWEGWVVWPYPDGKGNPTIGVGFNLDANDPSLIPGSDISEQQYNDLYNFGLPGNNTKYVAKISSPTISDDQVKTLLDSSIQKAVKTCEQTFGDTWNITDATDPCYINDARRIALLDVAFNRGSFKGKNGFPNLITDVNNADWIGAANELKYSNGKDPDNSEKSDWYKGNSLNHSNNKNGPSRADPDVDALKSGTFNSSSFPLTKPQQQKYDKEYVPADHYDWDSPFNPKGDNGEQNWNNRINPENWGSPYSDPLPNTPFNPFPDPNQQIPGNDPNEQIPSTPDQQTPNTTPNQPPPNNNPNQNPNAITDVIIDGSIIADASDSGGNDSGGNDSSGNDTAGNDSSGNDSDGSDSSGSDDNWDNDSGGGIDWDRLASYQLTHPS